mmetsp:Transcript_11322/g.27859  ORF Transcript_11322/g.27859 Transcript_11322/m.27859 type:complete len:313 (-) Transcript_11322:339-1277(-)
MASILLVGAGRMGHIRGPLLKAHQRLKLTGIVDVNMDAATRLADSCGTRAFPSLKQALDTVGKADAVCISSSHMHAELIREAADAKMHVMCEKPLANTQEEVAQIFEDVERNDIKLLTCWMRLRDPEFCSLRDRVKSSGSLHMINITSRDHPVPSADVIANLGSQIEDCMVHDISLILMINGLMKPTHVYASKSNIISPAVEDAAFCIMDFPNKVTATVTSSRFSPIGYQQMIEVCTSESIERAGDDLKSLSYSFPQRYESAFAMEVDYFAKVMGGVQDHDMEQEKKLNMLIAEITANLELSCAKGEKIALQ